MYRIVTGSGLFSDGDPASGTKGTLVTAAWLNDVQEEIAACIELFGDDLNAGDNNQLSKLLNAYSNRPGDFIFLPYQPTAQQMIDRRILQGNGGSVLDADFPEILAAWGGKIYGNVDATHFNLPALSGYFPRFWDSGAGVDPDASLVKSVNRTVGSPIITGFNTQYLEVGMYATGIGIPSGAIISSINSSTAVTLSANAVSTGSSNVTFTNRGNRGDGTIGDHVGTYQQDKFISHSHDSICSFTSGGTLNRALATDGNATGVQTTVAGGNETRGKNIYIWGGVFY